MEGANLAAHAKGTQDKWVEENADSHPFDAHRQLLEDEKYQVVYAKLVTENKWNARGNNTLQMTVKQVCDLINEVDLVLHNPDKLPINDMISRIEIEIGGSRIDCLNVDDIETQILTNCDLWGRKVSHVRDTTFIPLTLAPLHPNNLAFPSTKYHDMNIVVFFKETYVVRSHSQPCLYGNMYYVHMSSRNALHEQPNAFITMQNQHAGTETLKNGTNSIALPYNHPVYLMYFWGCDISKIKNVKLMLNDAPFYDGPVEPLIHKQRQRGVTTDVVVMYFSNDGLTSATNSSINFSRIDNIHLVIDTDQEEESPLYVVGLNMQPIRYMQHMVGLVFSK